MKRIKLNKEVTRGESPAATKKAAHSVAEQLFGAAGTGASAGGREVGNKGRHFLNEELLTVNAQLAAKAEMLTKANQQLGDLARFFQENPSPILRIARDGTILRANASSTPVLDFLKCQVGQLLPDQYRQVVAEILADSSPRLIEIELKEHIFALDFIPVVDTGYVNIYGRDITAQRKAEEAGKRTVQQWQETFDAMPDLISIHDRDYGIVMVNKAFARAFGMTMEQLVGKKCYEVFHKTTKPISTCPHQRTIETGQLIREEIFEPTCNAYFDISTVPVVGVSGEITQSVHIARDITELKKIDKMKDEFIGLISHELRTPLTVITGSLESAMSTGVSAEEVRELMQNAAEGASSLAHILENMLELSRYQAGRLQLRLEVVNITEIVRGMIAKLKRQGISQGFRVDLPGDLPAVAADPVRVERIVYNLLENAAKYSPVESEIRVTGRIRGDFIITEVTDQGRGISPDDQSKLFEPFQQLETPARATKGVGLGLVVCQRLVEAQGGWIKVASELGRGSTFSFALPIRRTKACLS